MNESLFDLLVKGGYTIFVLIICSVLSLKVIIEKYFTFKGIKEDKTEDLTFKVKTALEKNKPNEAVDYCKQSETKIFLFKVVNPLAPVFRYMIDHHYYSKPDLIESSVTRLDREVSKLEKGLGVLATLGAISPFIGLFGTVIGIIRSFAALSVQDTQNYTKVMSGIAEALIATAAGLFVAVPAVMFYNYFIKKLRLNLPLFEDSIHEVAHIIKKDQN
jgi:biopolymer transport protein ExbB/TolQ